MVRVGILNTLVCVYLVLDTFLPDSPHLVHLNLITYVSGGSVLISYESLVFCLIFAGLGFLICELLIEPLCSLCSDFSPNNSNLVEQY